ncbi:molecular chaperone DnaJ [Corynebacterium kroppenstedtii]|uniref:molecular chaperone DnaJ n=1 Tax=Corynebacterium sp. PCR 32 TaxID=3351342 RepID=UPI00309ACCA6
MAAQREWADKDYYKDLGVTRGASEDEIKKAYRKIARDNHPDSHPGDSSAEDRFKQASEAYAVIGDIKKRKEYDELKDMLASGGLGGFGGHGFNTARNGASGSFRTTFNSNFDTGSGFSTSDLFGSESSGGIGDILGGLFNGGRGSASAAATRGQRNLRGADVETEITLDFREATRGATVPIRLTNPSPCQQCHSSGAKPGSSPHTCHTCDGDGVISENRGAFGFSEPCSTCGGTGSKIDDPCTACDGSGVTTRTRTITVRVPSGVVDGQRVRLAGQGEAGLRGRPAGDLFVTVHVRPDKLFTRKGDDLCVTVPASFAELALGGVVTVPTLDSKVRVKIPAGTNDGRTLRVRGRGVPKRNQSSGDLLVTVKVTIPPQLDEGAASALRSYAAEEQRIGFDPRADWPGKEG